MSAGGAPRQWPLVLIDQPDDGYCEERGWVEAIVDEDEARDTLAEFCADDEGNDPHRPTGPITLVYLRLTNPAADYELQRWTPCRETAKTARPFWEVVVC